MVDGDVYEVIFKQRYYHKIFQQHPQILEQHLIARSDCGRRRGREVYIPLEVRQKSSAPNFTEWEVDDSNVCDPLRLHLQNVLRETAGPTPYVKRDICAEIMLSA